MLTSLIIAWLGVSAGWQVAGDRAAGQPSLPDVRVLMQDVVAHLRQSEAARKDYIYSTMIRMDWLQKDGSVKKEVTDEYESFTLEGIPVERHIRHDGKDLSPEEKSKESERIDKEVAKAKERRAKADASGRTTDARGDEIIPISRMFELGSFSNPRRVLVDGRNTVAVDFIGDPKAKTHNRGEDVIHDMAGTAWIDETDKTVQHLQGRFTNSFKIGGGLVANIARDTTFEFTAAKVNDEVWLPRSISAHGHVRLMLLFAIDGDFQMYIANYRRFKTTSTILPAGQTTENRNP